MHSILVSATLLFAGFAAAQSATGTASASGPCETIAAIYGVCSSLNGDEFDSASAYDQASCICFESDGSFNPNIWDNASVDCVNSGTADDKDIIDALTADDNLYVQLCSKYADAVAAETSTGGASSAVATETFSAGARTTGLPTVTASTMTFGGARTRTPTGGSTATAAATTSASRTASASATATHNAAANVKVGGAALLVGLGLAIVA